LIGGYTWFKLNLHGEDQSYEDDAPRNQTSLRSHYQLTDTFSCDQALYYVDQLSESDVPSYLRLDVGFTWDVKENVQLSIWGQNLLDDQHPEFNRLEGGADRASEVERGLYAQVRIAF
jgi:iron complex outermembrane receptor protein